MNTPVSSYVELEDCIPELVLNETRLDLISRIGGTGTRLLFPGLVTWENLGKIWEINGTGREWDYPISLGKVLNINVYWILNINEILREKLRIIKIN